MGDVDAASTVSPKLVAEQAILNEVQLERPLLKSPIESLNKSFRFAQKALEKEMTHLLSSINDLNKKKNTITPDDAKNSIDKLLTKMQNLKRKMEETKDEEEAQIKRIKSRLVHIKDVCQNHSDPNVKEEFNNKRVDRIIVDHLLREGLYDSAISLAKTSDIVDLVDIDLFLRPRKIIAELMKHTCTDALVWCNENKSNLKKINSNLEFNLRIQEFIEFVRESRFGPAISYARQHLAPNMSTNLPEIQAAMATLAFKKDQQCSKYRPLFQEERWNDLIKQFKADYYNLHCLTNHSLLNIALQSGLSVLKTVQCGDTETTNINCPLCDSRFQSLAEPLPVSLQCHSTLICKITGEIMNEDNPPMVLPNGNVYCKNAMSAMAAENNNKITDPKSRKEYDYSLLRRAFIS